MDKEGVKERVRFYTEMVKLGTVVSLTVGGGAVGLVFNLKDELRVLAFIGAVFVEVASVMFTVHSYLKVLDYLDRLEKLKEGG